MLYGLRILLAASVLRLAHASNDTNTTTAAETAAAAVNTTAGPSVSNDPNATVPSSTAAPVPSSTAAPVPSSTAAANVPSSTAAANVPSSTAAPSNGTESPSGGKTDKVTTVKAKVKLTMDIGNLTAADLKGNAVFKTAVEAGIHTALELSNATTVEVTDIVAPASMRMLEAHRQLAAVAYTVKYTVTFPAQSLQSEITATKKSAMGTAGTHGATDDTITAFSAAVKSAVNAKLVAAAINDVFSVTAAASEGAPEVEVVTSAPTSASPDSSTSGAIAAGISTLVTFAVGVFMM